MSVLDDLAELVLATAPDRRVRVAIDGVDASGKTTLADRLGQAVALSRPVARASVDSFHHPRAHRYRRGRTSPEGCYRDTFDLDALRGRLLQPFARDGSYSVEVFDCGADQPLPAPVLQILPDAALLVDGVFLQRPELRDVWDLVIHLQVPEEEILRRAARRDGADAPALYRARYLPAQRLYEAEARPAAQADVVLDNSDPAAPVVLRWPG